MENWLEKLKTLSKKRISYEIDWNGGEATPAGIAWRLRLQAQATPAESVRPGMESNLNVQQKNVIFLLEKNDVFGLGLLLCVL